VEKNASTATDKPGRLARGELKNNLFGFEDMRTVAQRLMVLCSGILAGALCLALYSVDGMPSAWTFGQQVEAWALMMTGPALSVILVMEFPPPVLGALILVAWLSLPALFAHPVKPNVVTGALTLLALFLWFSAGWLTMICAVWGA
jgi:hypothetical protein